MVLCQFCSSAKRKRPKGYERHYSRTIFLKVYRVGGIQQQCSIYTKKTNMNELVSIREL